MTSLAIPYYDLLIRLALYQREIGSNIRFRFQGLALPPPSGLDLQPYIPFDTDRSEQVLVVPEILESSAMETLPLFNFPDFEPIRLWQSSGYISLTSGKIEDATGKFTLEEKTITLDIVHGGW